MYVLSAGEDRIAESLKYSPFLCPGYLFPGMLVLWLANELLEINSF